MLEIRKFCYSTCTNNNYGSQWCQRCCHQASNAHCLFDCASSGLAEDNDRESAALVGNSLMRNNPLEIWWKLLKNWFMVTQINYSCSFWRQYCIIVLFTIWCFEDSTTKSCFCEMGNCKKYKESSEKLFAIGPTKSQPYVAVIIVI